MKRIARELDKSQAHEADDLLMAIAKAIGASWYVESVGPEPGSLHRGCEWRFVAVERGRDEFGRQIEAMLKAEVA